jgi:hypothetical protein
VNIASTASTTNVVDKTVVTTKVKENKKKGTKTTTVVEQKNIVTKQEKQETRIEQAKPVLSKFSLGTGVVLKTELPIQKQRDYYISAGLRLAGPLWLEATQTISSRETMIGVRYER